MTTELVAHMRVSHYKGLTRTLYGCDYGYGERKLKLNMTSGQSGFTIEMPLVCRYEDNQPAFCTQGVSKSDWTTFCKFISDERVLKVVFFDRKHSFLASVTSVGDRPPKKGEYVEVNFSWQEDDQMVLAWKKSKQWISNVLV